MSGSPVPEFADFYRAVNGRDPFPWQNRLAGQVEDRGWPDEIGVPTGLGKTACLDIAVWALARQAHLPPHERRAPTRTWYVVNRRLLVDVAYDHGQRLAALLADPQSAPPDDRAALEDTARALGSLAALGSEAGPLHLTRLRGGVEIRDRVPDPTQPALIFATVPMFASRWLFRGYGVSTSMRPIEAALAGTDSQVLLDEAHLARPLVELADAVAACDLGDGTAPLPEDRSRPRFVALTATGEGTADGFDLGDGDYEHPIVQVRLDADKPTRLVEATKRALAATLAAQAVGLLTASTASRSCVVFTNSPAMATDIAERALDQAVRDDTEIEVVVATGRMRDREADAVRALLLDPDAGAPATRNPDTPRSRPLLVVATQTLEVGADVDFDYLVTETAGVRALTQRFGRLNRLGNRPHAAGVICHPSDRDDWPIYGTEPATVWEQLNEAADTSDTVDLSPAHIGLVLGDPTDEPPRTGELLPEHLWEWAKTSLPPPGEPPVELFFDQVEPERGRVTVAWRGHAPDDGVRLDPAVHASETVDLPIYELRGTLDDQAIDQVRRLDDDRASLQTINAAAIRPGDTVVLPATAGLYDRNGWNPTATESVLDVSPLKPPTLRLAPSAIENLLAGSPLPADLIPTLERLADPPEDDFDETAAVASLLDLIRSGTPHPWLDDGELNELLDGLDHVVARPIDDAPFLPSRPARHRPQAGVRADAFDELSFEATSVELVEHLGSVGQTARRIAERLGLDKAIIDAVEAAGALHDTGKADARFQRWLTPDGGSGKGPVAKSTTPRHRIEATRVASGWPRGGRHELLSARLATTAGLDPLVVHLVAAHHGHGRPSLPAVNDPTPIPVTWTINQQEVTVTGDLSEPDWDQPARFRQLNEGHGYWGLALLEAIVRQADQAVSRAAQVL